MQRKTLSPANLLDQRYGPDNIPMPTLCNPAIDLIMDHRSVRSYRPDAPPAGTLETLVAAAQSAATSSNLQTWSVVAITDAVRKQKCAELAGGQKHIAECPLFLLFIADLARLNAVAADVQIPSAGNDTLEMFLVAAIDASLAAQNAVLAAESLGLSTVYIGGMRNRPDELSDLIGLPPASAVVFGLCVGYAAEGHEGAIKPRLPQEAVLHHERYDLASQIDAIARYNVAMTRFNESQNMSTKSNWSVHSARRVSGPESLSGRHMLMSILRRMGFFKAE